MNWNAYQTFEPVRTCGWCHRRFRQDEPGYCSIRCEDAATEAMHEAEDAAKEAMLDEPPDGKVCRCGFTLEECRERPCPDAMVDLHARRVREGAI